MDDESKEAALAEVIQESFADVTNRVLWDIVVHLLNIDEDSKKHILEAVCKVVTDQARDDLADHIQSLDADEFIDANDRLDAAVQKAYHEYVDYYSTPILTKEFMEAMTRSAVSNILEKLLDER